MFTLSRKPHLLRFFSLFCLAVASLCASAPLYPAGAAETLAHDPAPDWVLSADIPQADESQEATARDGVYYLLSDRQARIEDAAYTEYRRVVMKVLNRAGLESAARLQYAFDPNDETFRLHHVRVIRDGEILDKLDRDSVIVARQENDMANGITDGNLTVYYEIPDVRVGDIIDYDISWVNRSHIWPGAYANTLPLEWSVPVEHQRARILLKADRMLTIKNRNTEREAKISQTGGWREYLWEKRGVEAVPAQDLTPQTFANWGQVSVSTFSSWNEVTESLLEAYESGLELPADFAERQPWLTDERNSAERITAAIRYVQDQIRYVGDETGVGSHLPRKPQEVIARGWGDCKDKSLLLTAILRRIGVEAYVALTDLDQGYALPQTAPSPYVFDHAIVVIIKDGRASWIDPTNYDQGGVFPDIAQPAYGFGLVLKKGSDALSKMDPVNEPAPQKVLREVFDMAAFEKTGVSLRVTSDYRGREADKFRRLVSTSPQSKLAQDYLKYYQDRYPGLTAVSDLTIEDDRDANRIVTKEAYNFERAGYAGTQIETNFPLRADAVLNVIEKADLADRTAPISLPYPVDFQHVITLKNIGAFEGLANVEKSTDYFQYKRKDTLKGGDVNFSYRLTTLAAQAPLSAAEVYNEMATDLDDWGFFEYAPGQPEDGVDVWTWVYIAVFTALAAAIIYLPFGIAFTFKKDNLKMGEAVMHPVSLGKFVFLTLATLGLYAIFWMWRNWRWLKRQEEYNILPFWRSVFSVIWFFPLFNEIREHQKEAPPPVALGVILAILFAFLQVGTSIADKVYENETGVLIGTTVISLAGMLLFTPLVYWVNKINKDSPEAIAANSRWTGHTIGALAVGLAYWGVVFVGVFAPE